MTCDGRIFSGPRQILLAVGKRLCTRLRAHLVSDLSLMIIPWEAQAQGRKTAMCIATSWSARRVAILAALFDLGACFVFYQALTGGDDSSQLTLAASLMALTGDYLLLLGPQPTRKVAAALCAAACLTHVYWSWTIEGPRQSWQRRIRSACSSGPTAIPAEHAADLHELLRGSALHHA